MKNKSYDYIFGNGKFNTWFNIIVSIISCSAISFCLTELLFSFDFILILFFAHHIINTVAKKCKEFYTNMQIADYV